MSRYTPQKYSKNNSYNHRQVDTNRNPNADIPPTAASYQYGTQYKYLNNNPRTTQKKFGQPIALKDSHKRTEDERQKLIRQRVRQNTNSPATNKYVYKHDEYGVKAPQSYHRLEYGIENSSGLDKHRHLYNKKEEMQESQSPKKKYDSPSQRPISANVPKTYDRYPNTQVSTKYERDLSTKMHIGNHAPKIDYTQYTHAVGVTQGRQPSYQIAKKTGHPDDLKEKLQNRLSPERSTSKLFEQIQKMSSIIQLQSLTIRDTLGQTEQVKGLLHLRTLWKNYAESQDKETAKNFEENQKVEKQIEALCLLMNVSYVKHLRNSQALHKLAKAVRQAQEDSKKRMGSLDPRKKVDTYSYIESPSKKISELTSQLAKLEEEKESIGRDKLHYKMQLQKVVSEKKQLLHIHAETRKQVQRLKQQLEMSNNKNREIKECQAQKIDSERKEKLANKLVKQLETEKQALIGQNKTLEQKLRALEESSSNSRSRLRQFGREQVAELNRKLTEQVKKRKQADGAQAQLSLFLKETTQKAEETEKNKIQEIQELKRQLETELSKNSSLQDQMVKMQKIHSDELERVTNRHNEQLKRQLEEKEQTKEQWKMKLREHSEQKVHDENEQLRQKYRDQLTRTKEMLEREMNKKLLEKQLQIEEIRKKLISERQLAIRDLKMSFEDEKQLLMKRNREMEKKLQELETKIKELKKKHETQINSIAVKLGQENEDKLREKQVKHKLEIENLEKKHKEDLERQQERREREQSSSKKQNLFKKFKRNETDHSLASQKGIECSNGQSLQINDPKNSLSSSRVSEITKLKLHNLFFGDILKNKTQHKQYLKTLIETNINKQIEETKLLFHYDPINSNRNIHPYIDNRPNLLLIIQMENGMLVGGFSEAQLANNSSEKNRVGILFTVTQKKHFLLKSVEHFPPMKYDPYALVIGNDEIRLKWANPEKVVTSLFGTSQNYYRNEGYKKNFLFGEQGKQFKFSSYQVFEVYFQKYCSWQ